MYLLGSSLAAALLDGHFEHPVEIVIYHRQALIARAAMLLSHSPLASL
jgi:hypothetical protein